MIKKLLQILGYPAELSYLSTMKKKPSYEELSLLVATLESENKRKDERIAYLERMLFGSKRDKKKTHDGPGLFDKEFNEALDSRDAAIEKAAEDIKAESARRRATAKKAPSRPSKYRYSGLEERVRTLTPEGVNLDDYELVGNDVTRILHRRKAEVWVEVVVRPIYRHKGDKNLPSPRMVQAPAVKPVIGGGHVAADLLAQIVIDKYRYHLPEFRQVKQYADLGVRLPASTINDWVHAVADKLYPLYEALGEDIRSRPYLQIDEVPWRIADTPGKTRKGYAWQFFDATPDAHGLYFLYDKGSRGGAVVRAQLKGYRGAIQTDGYKVYDYFELQEDVTLLGCMAHVRRKFTEAQHSHPQQAKTALEYIGLLYELEANLACRGASPEETASERHCKAIPIMDAMEEWMKAASGTCTPSDLLGKALDYAYKLWPRLKRYADDGTYRIDNNPAERNQRPSVMGRKNYLFSKNDRGAEDNAVFYSLIESCEIVGIDPLAWLTDVLGRLHDEQYEEEIIEMLPYNYKKSQVQT